MMAKATRHSGESYTLEELKDPNLPIRIQRAALGEVDNPSVGTHSLESSKSESESSSNETQNPQEPAPTTGNPSDQSQTTQEDSSVHLMDGNGPRTDLEFTEDNSVPPYSQWKVVDLKAECMARGLTQSGKHDELVARLEAYDEEYPNE
jgi:hypothetical protein